jgi:hypothetical protein
LESKREGAVPEPLTRWDYFFIHFDRRDMGELWTPLETLGQDGWEMVGVSDGIAFFKRPKP